MIAPLVLLSDRLEMEAMSNEDSPDKRIEILSEVREDAKTTLEKQIQQMENLNTKSIEIVKFTPVIAGVFLTSLSLAAESIIPQDNQGSAITALANELNVFIFTGLFLLFISPVFAFAAYSPQRVVIGPGKDNIRRIVSDIEGADFYGMKDYELYYNINQTRAYAGFIRENQATQFRKD